VHAWTRTRRALKSEEFLRAVAASISLILRQPELYPIALDNFRRAILRRFPYEIFDEVAEKNLIIHAVFNCSQDPERWNRRLGNS
jgi:hypothetical protein